MAKQIIVTQNDYGIELETQFVDDKKKPLDITDYDVRVKIIYDDKTIDTVLAEHKDSVNGIAYIVLEKEHLINAGLHTSVWSVVDEDEHVTAQENVYYFVKDVEGSEDDTPTTDLPIDADGVLNKFNEIDNNLFELTEQGNVVNEEIDSINETLSVVNEQLDKNKNYLNSKINYITLLITDYEHLKNGDDWTLAIEQAMQDLVTKGGGKLLISKSIKAKYIKMRSNITIEGLYKSVTLEQIYNYDGHFISLLDENQINCNVLNLKILGFRTETKLPANHLIYFNNNDVALNGEVDHYHNIENCCLEGTNGNGICIVKSRGVNINNNWVRKCNGNGIDVNASDNVITNNNVSLCKYGYTSSNDGGSALRLNNNKAFYCYTNYYFPPYCQNLMVSNCESQSAELHGFHLENCLNSNFSNLITDSEGRTQENGVGVYIINCENCFINGIAREKHEGSQLSAIKTSGANKNITLDFKVATNKTPGYKDIIIEENTSISNRYKINDIERNFSNIITYNPFTSNTLGYWENWTKTNSSGMNAKLTFKNNTQTIQVYENNTTIYNAIKLTSQEFVVSQYDKISFKVLAEQLTSGLILKAEIVQYTSTNEAKDSRSVQTSALKQQVLEIDNYTVTDETVTKIKIILQCFANSSTGITGYAKFREPQLMIK